MVHEKGYSESYFSWKEDILLVDCVSEFFKKVLSNIEKKFCFNPANEMAGNGYSPNSEQAENSPPIGEQEQLLQEGGR